MRTIEAFEIDNRRGFQANEVSCQRSICHFEIKGRRIEQATKSRREVRL
jgi:hypothetical protein